MTIERQLQLFNEMLDWASEEYRQKYDEYYDN